MEERVYSFGEGNHPDVGFTIPANGVCYWVGEAMGDADCGDLQRVPHTVLIQMRYSSHLAKRLSEANFPGWRKMNGLHAANCPPS